MKDTTMQTAEKIGVTMPSEMVRAIRESVEAGEFASTSARGAARCRPGLAAPAARRLAKTLIAIHAHVRRSLDDPRPDLTGEGLLDARLEAALDEGTSTNSAMRHLGPPSASGIRSRASPDLPAGARPQPEHGHTPHGSVQQIRDRCERIGNVPLGGQAA